MGPVLPYIAIAIGQAAGSPAIGLAIKHFGYAHAFALFSTIGLFAALLSPLYPRHFDHEKDRDSGVETDAAATEAEDTVQPAPAGAQAQGTLDRVAPVSMGDSADSGPRVRPPHTPRLNCS